MEAKASAHDVHSTPKKLRFLIEEIKKLTPVQAMDKLFYSPRKSAKVLYKVIKSAVDNAKATLQIDEHLLKFKLLKVDQGHALKRYNPGGRGTVKPYKKKFSHVSVVVFAEAKKQIEKAKSELKVAKKSSPKQKTTAKKTRKDGTKS